MSDKRYQIVTADGQFVEPCTYYPTREGAESQFTRIHIETHSGLSKLRVVKVDRDAPIEVHYGKQRP